MSRTLDILDLPQHFAMSGVSWAYYEHTLEQIGDRPIRVSFLDGRIEIMSPLPKHEGMKKAVARLVEMMTFELNMPCRCFGSTTFRREEQSAGTEPDECYYFHNIDAVKGMERFDPLIHPAPDLAIEIDVFNPSIPREPIYARLGVGEIWRYNGERLEIRQLTDAGMYATTRSSRAFPFLPMGEFAQFVKMMTDEDENMVLRRYRDWVRSLSTGI